jgi:hypothetical protein
MPEADTIPVFSLAGTKLAPHLTCAEHCCQHFAVIKTAVTHSGDVAPAAAHSKAQQQAHAKKSYLPVPHLFAALLLLLRTRLPGRLAGSEL